jgi:hypothetical protein
MQLASPPATARRPTTLTAVARPAGEVAAALLLVEILRSPAGAVGRAQPCLIADALAGR